MTSQSVVEALASVADTLSAMLDIVDGHRAQLTERGYSPTAAEVMATDVHRALVTMAFTGKGEA